MDRRKFIRAMGSGELAGKAAARFLKDAGEISPAPDDLREAEARAAAALERKSGIDPEKVCARIQELIAPYQVCVKKSAESLGKALAEVKRLRDTDLPALAAKDPHELCKAHEAASLTLSAELFLKASRERKETRSDHCRSEYPEVDNQNWLKWINLQKGGDGRPETAFEEVPLSTYPIQPLKS